MVSKPESEDETGHGRTEKGCGECENPYDTKEFPGKRHRHEYPEKENHS